MSNRQKYTSEFKREALGLVIDPHLTFVEVTRRLDISETLLYKWKHRFAA